MGAQRILQRNTQIRTSTSAYVSTHQAVFDQCERVKCSFPAYSQVFGPQVQLMCLGPYMIRGPFALCPAHILLILLMAKMAHYHNFWKFLARKYCFGNKQQSTTFSKTRVPYQFSTVALLSWICAIKKNFAVLEPGRLEYCVNGTF